MKTETTLIAVAALLCGGSLHAQEITHVNWNHTWDFMHPMGTLPTGSGTTEPNSGATKWYAPQDAFSGALAPGIPAYSGPTFGGARVNGVPATTNSYDSGSGPGPLGYGAMDYATSANLPTGQFAGLGTTLTTPNSGNRRTGYFRTTFSVPNNGSAFVNPVISYLLDDGGYVYLDGVAILRVNMQGTVDDYTTLAAGTANTESHIRFASLNLTAGSLTGGNALNAGVIAGNATVLQQVLELTPGVHTLAVSVHNPDTTSSDLDLALRLISTEVQCAITASASNATRDFNGTPFNPSDDSVSFDLTVNSIGAPGPVAWTITGPPGSAALGTTGSYGTPEAVASIPIAEFTAGGLQVLVEDDGDPTCTATVAVSAPADGRERIHAEWNHVWSFMHPMGTLPPGSGATEPNAGATKWYAPQADFLANYSGPTFGGTLVGDPLTTDSYDSGSGSGPLGYGEMEYTSNGTAPTGQFVGLATLLTQPASGNRRTGYFRTTFTVPAPNFHVKPSIRYIMDDGGFVYLDGVAVLRVNMTGTVDEYTALAANTTNTESHIRYADLSLPVGSVTGGNTVGGQNIPGNAVVLQQVLELAPGVHTLAASVHNPDLTSSDLDLALQVLSTETDCAISASIANVVRSQGADPADSGDDTVDFEVTVTPIGTVSPGGWSVTGPTGSAALGTTGAYGVATPIAGVPVSEFPVAGLALQVTDAGNLSCEFTVPVIAPRVIASNSVSTPNATVVTSGAVPPAWAINETTRSLTMNNGGGSAAKVVRSETVDLSAVSGVVLFTGVFEVIDGSSGTEDLDTFLAELVFDGNTASPVSLITAYDTQVVNGVMDDDELASVGGTFTYPLQFYIPNNVDSVQLVLTGVNDSANETFIVRSLLLGVSPPTLVAVPGAVAFDNQASADPGDDTFSAPVTITPVNLGASTGWSSDAPPPASGLYSASNPVIFGPFPVSGGQQDITLSDDANGAVTASFSLLPAPASLAVSAPSNIVRHENGPGLADDTVTFDVTVTGGGGNGPGWTATGATPASGAYGPATFTLAGLSGSVANVTVEDASYPLATQGIVVNFPDRYVIGLADLGGGPFDLSSAVNVVPAPQWVNEPNARTLTMTNGGGGAAKTVVSDIVDLSSVVGSAVRITALLRVTDASSGTEDLDTFLAELILDGNSGSPVNLISAYDTQVVNGVLDDNELAPAGGTFDYPLTFAIPDGVQSAQLVIRGVNDSANETFIVRDVVFREEDTDRDGMPDDYEDANGLDKNDPGDAALDLDGDGQGNLAEFLAGTAANDSGSLFEVTASSLDRSTGDYSITWTSVPGKNYRIQASTDLEPPFADFSPVDIPAGVGATTTVTGTLPGPVPERLFVQVRVLP